MSRSTTIKRSVALASLSAVLMIPGMGSVSAHSFSAGSRVTIAFNGATFRGQVASPRPACERGRFVSVVKVVRDNDDAGRRPQIRVIGSDRTDSGGNWTVPSDPRPDRGRYFARARGRTAGRYGHNHSCGGDRSGTINPS